MRRRYIHQREDWPSFRWDEDAVVGRLVATSRDQGRLLGRMETLGLEQRAQANLETLAEDVVKSSAIEGENLDRGQVRSSLARRLGLDAASLKKSALRVDGVVEMMLDATQSHAAPLTADRLFRWQAGLFPDGHSGLAKITAGAWRIRPMQVVSGPLGREKIHFEAPAADRVEAEMDAFLDWFEESEPDPVLKAAVAHLWFVTIHPFEDGNGRAARAIADLALARSERSPQRFYSMSAQIRAERKAYYEILERTQIGNLDITEWLLWFLGCLDRAFHASEVTLESVLAKARFWERMKNGSFNDRQRKVLNRMLDGFEGKLTSSKWAALTRTSQDSATRDINDLLDRGILIKNPAGGRSTSFALAPRKTGA